MRADLIDRRVDYQRLYEEALVAAQKRGPVATTDHAEIPVVPLSYLLAMKLAADRPQDEVDAQQIVESDQLDYPEARAIVEQHLGVFAARRLDRMARLGKRPDAPPDYENGGPSR